MRPTGAAIEVSGVAVHRVVNGQLVEHWTHMAMEGFMRQLETIAQAIQSVG